MLGEIAGQGIRCVVATPHFYANHDTPERFLKKRQASLERLMENWSADLELRVGAEVHYFEGISDCDALEELAISGTRCVLIEMPTPPWSERMLYELQGIRQKRGLTPIIAHIDRYISPLRSFGIPERLRSLPVLIQANAGFFIRRSTRSFALKMLQNGRIHLLGSDCHDLTDRKPNLGEAVEIITRKLGSDAMDPLAAVERRVLSGEDPL